MGMLGRLIEFWGESPLNAIVVTASAIALALTPISFVILGRQKWFQARRGRTLQRPSFPAMVSGMLLVMGVPAIFLALVVKSQYFDEDRFEFDPNRTLTVLDQGRRYEAMDVLESAYRADEAVRNEMQRLADERKNLLDSVKKLDQAMLVLRNQARTTPAVVPAVNGVLDRLADIRKSVGLDGPQQLVDLTALPVDLATAVPTAPSGGGPVPAPQPASAPVVEASAPAKGLATAVFEEELASVPEAQRELASFLALDDVPDGWVVGLSGDRHLETFHDGNLYEKMDGRAESFLQYNVKGMAYAFFHPEGEEDLEAQLYVFEMADTLKALGKYGSEKPEGVDASDIGAEGYIAAGSVFFHLDRYYAFVTLTSDDPRGASFAVELARKVAGRIEGARATVTANAGPVAGQPAVSTPDQLFALLPEGPEKTAPKYVASDVFGYSFLSDVFLADYKEGDTTWQAFLRPYASPAAAKKALDQYLATADEDGADVTEVEGAAADRMIVSANIGLIDVIILKGNTLAGVNGSTDAKSAERFARAFAEALPDSLPPIASEEGNADATEASPTSSPYNEGP